jgi:hypothetical protein
MSSSISKALLLMQPDPVDCSWCAAESGAPTTDSPSICARHSQQLQQQSAERHAVRHEIRVNHKPGQVARRNESLSEFLARSLGGR